MYGPTETTIWSSLAYLTDDDEVTLGQAIHATTLSLIDEAGQPVAAGGSGELCIGGANLARGYLGRPGLTAERFVPDPSGPPGQRVYRTGDLCRRATDGTLIFLGRLDQQVKLHGHRIELGEIEAALRAVAGVRDAVAVISGAAETRRIVAYAVTDIDPATLERTIAATLPAPMRPAAIVPLDALPRTPNNKLDRTRLPDPGLQLRTVIPPQTPAEVALATIWQNVLELETVSTTDNFFHKGGNSLSAMRVAALAAKAGLPGVTPAMLFAHPDLGALAREATAGGRLHDVVAMNRRTMPRNLFCIHPGYGLVSEYRPPGRRT